MLRKSPKKTIARSTLPSGELTCSEGQVEDMLSAGESTEEERVRPPNPTEQKAVASSHLAAIRKRKPEG
jgi:hypothetical protein